MPSITSRIWKCGSGKVEPARGVCPQEMVARACARVDAMLFFSGGRKAVNPYPVDSPASKVWTDALSAELDALSMPGYHYTKEFMEVRYG